MESTLKTIHYSNPKQFPHHRLILILINAFWDLSFLAALSFSTAHCISNQLQNSNSFIHLFQNVERPFNRLSYLVERWAFSIIILQPVNPNHILIIDHLQLPVCFTPHTSCFPYMTMFTQSQTEHAFPTHSVWTAADCCSSWITAFRQTHPGSRDLWTRLMLTETVEKLCFHQAAQGRIFLAISKRPQNKGFPLLPSTPAQQRHSTVECSLAETRQSFASEMLDKLCTDLGYSGYLDLSNKCLDKIQTSISILGKLCPMLYSTCWPRSRFLPASADLISPFLKWDLLLSHQAAEQKDMVKTDLTEFNIRRHAISTYSAKLWNSNCFIQKAVGVFSFIARIAYL